MIKMFELVAAKFGIGHDTNSRRTELTISMLTREMIRLTAEYLRDEHVEFDGSSPPDGARAFQKQVQMRLTAKELRGTLDDVAERHLHPQAIALADALKAAKIQSSYKLPIGGNPGTSEAVHIFDGLSMRGRLAWVPGTDDRTAVFDVLGSSQAEAAE